MEDKEGSALLNHVACRKRQTDACSRFLKKARESKLSSKRSKSDKEGDESQGNKGKEEKGSKASVINLDASPA